MRLTEDGKVPPDMGPEKLQELEVLVQDLVRERAQERGMGLDGLDGESHATNAVAALLCFAIAGSRTDSLVVSRIAFMPVLPSHRPPRDLHNTTLPTITPHHRITASAPPTCGLFLPPRRAC